MPSIVNKRGLLCNESRALFLLEYKRELSLLKKFILSTENGIGSLLSKDPWCYNGICDLFAKSIVSHARMAYHNMLLGYFDAANMVLRALIENSACFEVIYLYEAEKNGNTIHAAWDGAFTLGVVYDEDSCMRIDMNMIDRMKNTLGDLKARQGG